MLCTGTAGARDLFFESLARQEVREDTDRQAEDPSTPRQAARLAGDAWCREAGVRRRWGQDARHQRDRGDHQTPSQDSTTPATAI